MRADTLKNFWQASRDAFFLFDSSIRILDLNPAALKIWKKKRAELVGHKLVELFPPTETSGRLRLYQEVIRTGKPRTLKDVTHPLWGGRRVDIHAFKVHEGLGAIISDITRRSRIEADLEKSNQLLKNLAIHNQRLLEEETKTIAREIHDEMAPTLTTFKMDLCWLLTRLRAETAPDPALAEKIKSMSDLVDRSIDTMRRVCSKLRPALLDDLGLAAAIEWQVEDYRRRSSLDCRLHIDCNGLALGPDLSVCVFRIFQEAFTNLLRHAKATKASVRLSHSAKRNELRLRVSDNGRGILPSEASSPTSFGLIGMRERIDPYGGRLKISGAPGKGTTINVVIPLEIWGQKYGDTSLISRGDK